MGDQDKAIAVLSTTGYRRLLPRPIGSTLLTHLQAICVRSRRLNELLQLHFQPTGVKYGQPDLRREHNHAGLGLLCSWRVG